jgi:hypothetical protein
VRGKLRDKRLDARRDKLSREQMERRRNIKRGTRTAVTLAWQNELLAEENYDNLLEDDEELLLEQVKK